MIKGINSSSRYITVSGGSTSNPYISPGSVGAGMMRYNPNMNCIEVNDGNMWKSIESTYASIELTPDAESLLQWAREQRDKQWAREQRIRDNPALKKAYEAIVRAEKNYDLLDAITGDDQHSVVAGYNFNTP